MDRQELSRESRKHGLIEYWLERAEIEAPKQKAVPFCWRWSDIYPLLKEAAKIVPVEEAHRRALLFANPGMHPRPFITSTLYGACSLYNPGESAEVHRHMSSASRFALMGDGGFTTIEGEKCSMQRGDLIINPNGAWHDHGNDGTEPVIWVDVLDLPMAEALNSSYFDFEYSEHSKQSNSSEPIRRRVQTVTAPANYSARVYGTGGIMPKFVPHRRGKGFGSPMFVYRWHDTYQRLKDLRELDGDPRDGIVVEYVDPVNGCSVLPTLSFRVQLLRPDFAPQMQRRTASTLFCVVQGRGRTEMDGGEFSWKENDVFVVPSWHWYRNISESSTDDLVLFSVSDSPALEKLGFFRSQARTDTGDVIDLVSDYRGMVA